MNKININDAIFLQAVEAIDTGNISLLKDLLDKHPRLVHNRAGTSDEEGYFKDPYLLWFVADNPIRHPKLPANITEITASIIQKQKQENVSTMQFQLDYTLGLVATGRIARESGVQIALMDLLIDEGATPGKGAGALAHGNKEAAAHLIKRGGQLTLSVALGLDRMNDVMRLLNDATASEKQTALMTAAFYGKADMIDLLLKHGADPNGFIESPSGFHSHASPLHQAVASGSLESVKRLVEAGASRDVTDKIYEGTPLEWALHMQAQETATEEEKEKYAAVAAYLSTVDGQL